MYVKLINPRTRHTMVIPCGDEVYYELLDPMSESELQKWEVSQEGLGHDPRKFTLWPRAMDNTTEIVVTHITLTGRKPTAILTNYDAYLCNDTGKTMERLHRYAG